MCLLALRYRTVPGVPVLLAANRDERHDRPFDPPRLHAGTLPFVAPVDRVAGGTWIGVNAAGLVVAVTNRPQREVVSYPGVGLPDWQPDKSPGTRSRGLLALDALRAASSARLRDALERHLRGQETVYNNFHLAAADAAGAFVVRYHDGWTEISDVDEGDHFLTNEDELDEPRVAAIAAAAADGAAAEADRIAALLAGHEPSLPGGRAICKHGEKGGTVASAILAVPDAGVGEALLRFAAGPPCTAPWVDCSALVRGLAR